MRVRWLLAARCRLYPDSPRDPCAPHLQPSSTTLVLRIAFFGAGGNLTASALRSVAGKHLVVTVVGVQPRFRTMAGRIRTVVRRSVGRLDSLERAIRDLGLTEHRMRHRADPRVIEHVRVLRPDVICIAGFPWVLPASVLEIARIGAINLHTSLLPRHRGPMPLFWVYAHDDAETGVTVHWATDVADAGDIIAQTVLPIARGENIVEVHNRSCAAGALLLAIALDEIERGASARTTQDEARATTEGVHKRGTSFVKFDEWDVERVWHTLAGLRSMIHEPLVDENGRALRYRAVTGYERRAHDQLPGAVRRGGAAIEVYCRGGVVTLEERLP